MTLQNTTLENIRSSAKLNLDRVDSYDTDELFARIQSWIDWNAARGLTAATIRAYWQQLRILLWRASVRLDPMDVRYRLRFPKTLRGLPPSTSRRDIGAILAESSTEFRFQLLALVSSGMRVGELAQLTADDLHHGSPNIRVVIPARITKTGQARVTYFSRQVSDMIRYRLRRGREDIFGGGERGMIANRLGKRFRAARERAGLTASSGHTKQNRYDMHLHSLRSYFVTELNKIQFGAGHILAGHDFYMKTYNRYAPEDILNMYRRAEPALEFRRGSY